MIKQIAASNKLSIIATCRVSESDEIQEKLGGIFPLFKTVEIKPLNSEDTKEIADSLHLQEKDKIEDHIGSFFEK